MINYRNQTYEVVEYKSQNAIIYHVLMTNPIFITETLDASNNPFWTSIPEGRLELAEEIGALIGKHQKKPEQQNLF